MNRDIFELISMIEDDVDELEDYAICFEDGFEIDYSNNDFNLWVRDKSENRWMFDGIYDNICEDLLNHNGIIVDGVVHKFKFFEYAPLP